MTSRDRVIRALKFDHPDRPPRDLWTLPAVEMFQKKGKETLLERFPMDIGRPTIKPGISEKQKSSRLRPFTTVYGFIDEPPKQGQTYIDEWGSIRHVAEDGVTGEVKKPVLESLSNLNRFSPPWDFLESTHLLTVDEQCEQTDQFMLSATVARPFETMQFLRGTVNLFEDLIREKEHVIKLRDMVHEYNLEHIKIWLKTKVDGIFIMDDWGTERQLLISPNLWRELFKPLYKEYCHLIHMAGKYVMFHSDGWIEDLFPDLIEIGIDALNAQLFIMGIESLGQLYQGKICFWGEIDRRLLFFGSPQEIREAVYRVRKALDDDSGGVIAQCEWGKDVPKQNVEAVYQAWDVPLEDVREEG